MFAHSLSHCWQVAQLSWLERRVAAALFAEVPSSTYEEALDHFMAAEKLRPTGWKENRLFIAKCYILMNEFSQASAWLEQAASASNVTPDVGCARYLSVWGWEWLVWAHKGCCVCSCSCLVLAGKGYCGCIYCCDLAVTTQASVATH